VHKYQEGDKASVCKQGAEVEMIVFRQAGELVSLFDQSNRYYLFHIGEVRPVTTTRPGISVCNASTEATVREDS
jgi:hypothetical protein